MEVDSFPYLIQMKLMNNTPVGVGDMYKYKCGLPSLLICTYDSIDSIPSDVIFAWQVDSSLSLGVCCDMHAFRNAKAGVNKFVMSYQLLMRPRSLLQKLASQSINLKRLCSLSIVIYSSATAQNCCNFGMCIVLHRNKWVPKCFVKWKTTHKLILVPVMHFCLP